MPPTATNHRARRHEHRRQLILQSAAELFGRLGYDGTTLEAIAESLGLSKAALYYYVDSKEALLTELCVDISQQILEEAAELATDDAGPEERLRAFLTAHFTVIHEHPAGRVLGENLDAVFEPAADPDMRDARHQHEQALARILSDGAGVGVFRAVDAGATARFVLAALNTSTRWYQPGGRRSTARMASDVVDLLLEGISLTAPGTAPQDTAAAARRTIEQLYEALARGNGDRVVDLLAPDAVIEITPGMPVGGGRHVGPAAARDDGWWQIGNAFSVRPEPTEWVTTTDGRMLVRGRYRGRRRSDGADVDAPFMHLVTIDEQGRIANLSQVTDTRQWGLPGA